MILMKEELIPKPRSMFLLVNCNKCNAENIVYSHTTTHIRCKSCKTLIAKNTGGYAKIFGEIVERLDNP